MIAIDMQLTCILHSSTLKGETSEAASRIICFQTSAVSLSGKAALSETCGLHHSSQRATAKPIKHVLFPKDGVALYTYHTGMYNFSGYHFHLFLLSVAIKRTYFCGDAYQSMSKR